MSALPESLLVEEVKVSRLVNYLFIAAAVLATHDTLVHIEQEIELVWGRYSWTTALYALNRYGVPLQLWLNVIWRVDSSLSVDACYHWALFSQWSFPCFIIVVEALLLLRVIGMYSDRHMTVVFLIALFFSSSAVELGITGWILEGSEALPTLPVAGLASCGLIGMNSFFWVLWLPSLVMETVLFALTAAKTVKGVMSSADTPLLTLLLRDGVIYYTVIFVLMLANLLIYAKDPEYLALLPQLTLAISSIICARIFLNLRSYAEKSKASSATRKYEKQPDRTGGTSEETELQTMAATGAPTDSWITSHAQSSASAA